MIQSRAPKHPLITVVGSFNMDLVIEAPRFPVPGEAILGKNFRRACGGKGANQACAVARLGLPAFMIGAVLRTNTKLRFPTAQIDGNMLHG
jgi:ribokinase